MERKNWSKKLWSEEYKRKRVHPDDLLRQVRELREKGQTIATINGSFDLLHAGHLQILFEAGQQADILLVALNSDSSIQQYKGPDRPIIPLVHRMQMMAMLECVDYVTWFEEITPLALLECICPDVHVNGSEYGEECIEKDLVLSNGGRLHIVQRDTTLSTSEIIQKIRVGSLCV